MRAQRIALGLVWGAIALVVAACSGGTAAFGLGEDGATGAADAANANEDAADTTAAPDTPADLASPADVGPRPDALPVLDTAPDAAPDAAGCRSDGDCDDGTPCTTDFCDADGACRHRPVAGLACDDGDACTEGETCDRDGLCVGGAPVALPDDPCLDCRCDAATGPACTPRASGASCDDGDCCTLGDRCAACAAGEPGCGESGLACEGQPDPCDDDDTCTADACACAGGVPRCTHEAVADDTPCELDPNACAEPDTCQSGVCVAGAALPLDDGNACTRDRCDKGDVLHDPLDSGQCDDGDDCTTGDACLGGACVGSDRVECALPPCASSVSCVTGQGCVPVWRPAGAACDDQNSCTQGDACSVSHTCEGGAPVAVDDGNPCTRDACDRQTGAVTHTPFDGPCDDGDACTTGDVCADGSCAGRPVVCDDQDLCTTDVCVDGLCRNDAALGAGCDDGDPCTTGDVCGAAGCAGAPVVCRDSDPCTIDRCVDGACHFDAATGAPCDDGDPCTVGDACNAAGACQPGAAGLDGDTDGYVSEACPGGTDCDDEALAIHPGAREDCANGIDDDCDGATDGDDDACATGPTACSLQMDCVDAPGTLCARWPIEGEAWCSRPCARSEDCAPGQVCYPVPGSAMVGFCATGPGGPASVAAACATDSDCRSGFCDADGLRCVDLCTGEGYQEERCPGPSATCTGVGDLAAGFTSQCLHDSLSGGPSLAIGQSCSTDGFTFDSGLCASGHCDLTYPLVEGQLCAPLCGGKRDCPFDDQVCDLVLYSSTRVTTSIPFTAQSNRTHDVLLGCYWSPSVGTRPIGMACSLPSDCYSGKCLPVDPDQPTRTYCTDYCASDAHCAVGLVCGFAELNLVSWWLQDPNLLGQPVQPYESTLARICMFDRPN